MLPEAFNLVEEQACTERQYLAMLDRSSSQGQTHLSPVGSETSTNSLEESEENRERDT